MRDKAMAMFKDSVDAYVREDVELARAIVHAIKHWTN